MVHAISGLGKSTLANLHPDRVLDADRFVYEAVAQAFPGLEARDRLRAWRALCQRRPWERGGADLTKWAETRAQMFTPITEVMVRDTYALVLTSLLHPPWVVSAYYGVELGRYIEHLSLVGRASDNDQTEAMNNRLEGYGPLVRLAPGTHLADCPELLAVVHR